MSSPDTRPQMLQNVFQDVSRSGVCQLPMRTRKPADKLSQYKMVTSTRNQGRAKGQHRMSTLEI